MNGYAISYLGAIGLVALINLLPVFGVLSAERLADGYGVEIASAELEILLRHRALLFGIVGGFVLASLWLPAYRGAALLLAGISMVGFLLLAAQVGAYGPALGRVVRADIVGVLALVVASLLHVLRSP